MHLDTAINNTKSEYTSDVNNFLFRGLGFGIYYTQWQEIRKVLP